MSNKENLTEYTDEYIKNLDQNLIDKIDSLVNYFNDYGIDYDNFSEILSDENILNKKAYPNNDYYMSVPGQSNVDKWIKSLQEIYYLNNVNNKNKKEAIDHVTKDWLPIEKFNFLNWLKFYEEGNHLKYKMAQVINGLPHYLLDLTKKPEQPNLSGGSLSNSEKKQIIERQRNKIISRLDSAEKLLRSEDGNLFAGNELENLIDSIYNLKKKIQVINKLSISSKLYDDLIIRESNVLKRNGFVKAAHMLFSLSQQNDNLSEEQISNISPNPTIEPTPVVNPQVGGLPNTEPYSAPTGIENETISPGIIGFLNNLETGSFTPKKDIEDVEEIIDNQNVNDDLFIVEAQAIEPQQTQLKPNPSPVPNPNSNQSSNPTGSLNQTSVKPNLTDKVENDKKQPIKEVSKQNQIDTMINSLFQNITIQDAINKLEDLSNIFNAREIPRQLALVDMMLNSLGLAQYFPSLPEATEKALDSHNYISTRIDDILSKLKNTANDNSIKLTDHSSGISKQDTTEIQNKLEKDEQSEILRKQRRKDKENKKLEEEFKETPEIDLANELANNMENTTQPKANLPTTNTQPRTPTPVKV